MRCDETALVGRNTVPNASERASPLEETSMYHSRQEKKLHLEYGKPCR